MSNRESYPELKSITDAIYSGKRIKFAKNVVEILSKHGIRLRQKDGKLHSVNISIPKSKTNTILVGLRYIKKDRTYTEDHFLFEQGRSITPFYKGKVEKTLLEYKGTHKQQLP